MNMKEQVNEYYYCMKYICNGCPKKEQCDKEIRKNKFQNKKKGKKMKKVLIGYKQGDNNYAYLSNISINIKIKEQNK